MNDRLKGVECGGFLHRRGQCAIVTEETYGLACIGAVSSHVSVEENNTIKSKRTHKQ